MPCKPGYFSPRIISALCDKEFALQEQCSGKFGRWLSISRDREKLFGRHLI